VAPSTRAKPEQRDRGSGRIAATKEEILQLIRDLRAQPSAAPAPKVAPTKRLELMRWREAFLRDAVADRLSSICSLLEERVDALEREVAAEKLPREMPAPLVTRRPAEPALEAAPVFDAVAPEPFASQEVGALPPALDDGPASLKGQIQEGVLSDILQMLSGNLKTGLFTIVGPETTANLWYEDGEIRHAVAGELKGEDAFFAAIAQPSGTFFFVENTNPPPERTINNKTQFLILEGLRKMDEEAQGGEGQESPFVEDEK
jgi:hypothetical protein